MKRIVHYRVDQRAKLPPETPWLVLSNSLGTDLTMWDAQLPALLPHFRVLRYDTRGHGATTLSCAGLSLQDLGHDVLDLLDALDIARAHFCGISMGGMIGTWLGIHHPQRLSRLVLSNTAAKIGTVEQWNTRIARLKAEGMPAIADDVIARWATPDFMAASPRRVARLRAGLCATPADGYAACCAVIRDMDQRAALGRIPCRTLVIAGARDLSTPAEQGRELAAGIPGARYLELPGGHLSNIECVEDFNAALLDFLLGE